MHSGNIYGGEEIALIEHLEPSPAREGHYAMNAFDNPAKRS